MLNLRIGFFLGLRQIQRANQWTNVLIITIVLFTFLNLVAVSGILTGIVDGALRTVRSEAIGDITLKALPDESHILETERVLRELDTFEGIQSFTPRYEGFAIIEANYKERRDLSIERDTIGVNIQGVNPVGENETLNLNSLVTEGEPLDENDFDSILIGKYYIDRYAKTYGDVFDSLKNVYPGDTVRVTVGDKSEEFKVKGILDSKIDIVSLSVFIPEKNFRRLFDRANLNADHIYLRLKPEYDEQTVEKQLQDAGIAEVAQIQSFNEGIPKFIKDTTKTFELLSTLIGAISIVIASITVFIIIFINILSRRRQIGILKAIGIRRQVIQYAYATQAAFYAIVGSTLGVLIVYLVLIPYFEQNPIDFPYSDVILSASGESIAYRCIALFIIMIFAGILPAWMIAKQNTLNTILGRK